MPMNIITLVKTMVVLFAIMIIGYIINKKGILNKEANQVLSALIVKVTGPSLVFISACGRSSDGDKGQIIKIFLTGITLYSFLILFSKIIVVLLKPDIKDKAVYELMMIFMNTAFIGYPVLRALFGDYAIFASSVLNIPFNILLYSYGIYVIEKEGQVKRGINIKDFINPGIIAALMSLFIFLLEINVPEIIQRVVSMVGEITIPLSMILIGSSLALIPLKNALNNIGIYIMSFIKLIIMPIITFFIARLFIKDVFLIGLLTVNTALPAGSMIVMLTTEYKGNVKSASIGVFITTVLSVITIPMIVYFLLK